MPLLSFEGVGKAYRGAGVVLDGFDLDVDPGEFVGVWGERRSGKTTLLRLAAGVEAPDSGVVRYAGRDLADLSETGRSRLRLGEIALATIDAPSHVAASAITVADHVGLPLVFGGRSQREAADAAHRSLHLVGAGDCMSAAPFELRPGEGTRVALARALVREPRLLLVDEPAVTPDPTEREEIRDLLHQLTRSLRVAMLVASEEVSMMVGAPRILSIGDGNVVSNETTGTVISFPAPAPTGDSP
ncbi:MAG: ATP-binding cassette domain-containing protein [Solirubrobacterales bacterium]|nr:ATP-binding cassette domain-containing protein [Solirubrobacterales bacterium]